MTSTALSPLTPTVTIDHQLPAVIATNETRALAILAKQKSRLTESAALIVECIFEALEQKAPISDSGTYALTFDNRSFAGKEEQHAEAASFGISPYLSSPESLSLLETAIRKELGGAFGTMSVSAYSGMLYVNLSVQRSDTSAATGNAKQAVSQALALHDASAITANIGARKKELADRRDLFSTIAKSPAMQGVYALAKSRTGSTCAVNVIDSFYLKPNGRLVTGGGGEVRDDNLLALDLGRVAPSVESLIAGARAAALPKVCELSWLYAIFG